MAGRKREPGAEVRDQRTTIRWSRSEIQRLEKAKNLLGFTYDVDLIRALTLRQLDLIESASGSVVAE